VLIVGMATTCWQQKGEGLLAAKETVKVNEGRGQYLLVETATAW
jgi:hypothetical protein